MNYRDHLTPAQIAFLDQVLAQSNPIVDHFVKLAIERVRDNGEDVAIGLLANVFDRGEHAKVSTVAAIALVRLAKHAQTECTADATDRGPEARP